MRCQRIIKGKSLAQSVADSCIGPKSYLDFCRRVLLAVLYLKLSNFPTYPDPAKEVLVLRTDANLHHPTPPRDLCRISGGRQPQRVPGHPASNRSLNRNIDTHHYRGGSHHSVRRGAPEAPEDRIPGGGVQLLRR